MHMFDEHFNPKVNTIHEKAVFYYSQQPGKNVEIYIHIEYDLAEHADFTDKVGSIRGRLKVELKDRELSEKFQLQPYIMLKVTIKIIYQNEQVKTQMSEQWPSKKTNANLGIEQMSKCLHQPPAILAKCLYGEGIIVISAV